MSYSVGKGKPPRHSQFKKGQSGNPEGGRKHDPIRRAVKTLTLKEIVEVLNDVLQSRVKDLENELKDPEIPLAKLIVGKAALRASKKGDIKLFNTLVEPVVGKQF